MQEKLKEDLLHALRRALPFVEDAEDDPSFKKGYVAKVLLDLRAVIAAAEAKQAV